MQTFLPYKDFRECAKILDYRRLGKQRVEAKQILEIISGEKEYSRWANHPAVLMWTPGLAGNTILYTDTVLAYYGFCMCTEWRGRGYVDNLVSYFWRYLCSFPYPSLINYVQPPWLTDELCLSHQSNLVRKNPEHYRKYFPDVPNNLPYLWPIKR